MKWSAPFRNLCFGWYRYSCHHRKCQCRYHLEFSHPSYCRLNHAGSVHYQNRNHNSRPNHPKAFNRVSLSLIDELFRRLSLYVTVWRIPHLVLGSYGLTSPSLGVLFRVSWYRLCHLGRDLNLVHASPSPPSLHRHRCLVLGYRIFQ